MRNSVSLTAAASRAFRMAGSSWPTVNSSTRVPGMRPALAKSSFKLLNRSSRRNWERTTWVPTPRLRTSRPFCTNSWIACRAVGRDRPSRLVRESSFSSRSPGASAPVLMACSMDWASW